jgi:MFS family permease
MKKGVIKKNKFNEQKEIKKSLNYSIKDGVAASVTGSAGDNFVSAYAVSLGASNMQIGLLSALPNIIPGELFTSKVMEKVSRKKIMMWGTLVQVLMWPLMALLCLLTLSGKGSLAATILIIFFSIYATASWFVSPAWASWMKDLTEKTHIGKYFGKRNKICGVVGLIVILIAGIVLDKFKEMGYVFIGFALLFTVAAIGRAISRIYLSKQYEPKLKPKKDYYFSFWQFLKKSTTNNYGRFAIFIALFTFSVNISGPFFTPYMLNVLKLNYFTFTIINLVISTVFTLLTMPFWGKFIDKYGCVRTMSVTVWVLPLVPIMWLVSPSVYWLAFVQIISGIAWAGFNLASGTFTYQAVTKERMNLCIAYTSMINGIAVFLGAIVGGLIASLNISFMNVLLFVFLVSGIMRLIVIITAFSLIKEVRPVNPAKPFIKIILRPLKEMLIHPFVANYNHNNAIKKR